MPRLSVWMIRTALVYLGIGFTFGALILFTKGVPVYPLFWRLLPLHMEFLLIGWLVQLAAGVAFWILPRLAGPQKRGSERLGWLAYGLLNLGILLLSGGQWWGSNAVVMMIGRLAEVAAAALFSINLWPRIKPFG